MKIFKFLIFILININFINAYTGLITHYNEYEWYPVNYSGHIYYPTFGCSVNGNYINDTQYSLGITLSKYWKTQIGNKINGIKIKCGSCICIDYYNNDIKKRICSRFLDFIGNNNGHNDNHLDLTLALYKSLTNYINNHDYKVEWNFYNDHYCYKINKLNNKYIEYNFRTFDNKKIKEVKKFSCKEIKLLDKIPGLKEKRISYNYNFNEIDKCYNNT